MRHILTKAAIVLFGIGCVAADGATHPSDPVPSRSALWAAWNALRGDAYELDSVPRRLENPKARVACERDGLVEHRGTTVRYHGPVDVLGFDFGPATKTEPRPEGLSKHLRGPFEVRVRKHWQASATPTAELHAKFLETLTERLAERRDIFRSMFGPGHPGHADHFHFDMAPWRWVDL